MDISIDVNQFRHHSDDTGSVEVQAATLTAEIIKLTEHFKRNPKDYASKRGMIKMVAKRRKALEYLQRKNPDKYKELIDRLGIRR